MTIADRVENIRQEIGDVCAKHHINNNKITLLAVSKTHAADAIQAAYDTGIRQFGESYLQEALDKISALNHLPITWHFIGPIQSNKTKPIAEHFDWVQSVDRKKLLLRLSEQRPHHLKPINVCIQINYFNEEQKKGVQLNELPELLDLANNLPNIKLRGLMAIPPKTSSFGQQLAQYQQIVSCFNRAQQDYSQMDTLSIGMSNDLDAAIMAGSTMVRIGTALFGKRK